MAGRFPFDPHNQQQQQQLSAQMRAALGLPGNGSIEDAFFLHQQQQQRQQDLQRDIRLRQLLLQGQLEQQGGLGSLLHEQQFRALGDTLQDYPDLQQQYHTLLLSEQLQRQEERAILEAEAQMRYEDELRRHQQLQMHQQQQQQHQQQQQQLQPELQPSHAQAHAELEARAQVEAEMRSRAEEEAEHRARAQQAQAQPVLQAQSADPREQAAPGGRVANFHDLSVESVAAKSPAGNLKRSSPSLGADDVYNDTKPPAAKRQAKDPKEKVKKYKQKTPKAKKATAPLPPTSQTKKSKSQLQVPMEISNKDEMEARSVGTPKQDFRKIAPRPRSAAHPPMMTPSHVPGSAASYQSSAYSGMSQPPQAYAAMGSPISPALLDAASESRAYEWPAPRRLGTLEGLLAAAEAESNEERALDTLRELKSVEVSESDIDIVLYEKPIVTRKNGESISLVNGFSSKLPLLPEEPLYEGPLAAAEDCVSTDDLLDEAFNSGEEENGNQHVIEDPKMEKAKTRTVSNVLEYPYPVDVWWPSMSDIRMERKAAGYESDEDNFEEDPSLSKDQPPLRVNLPEIRRRLVQDLRPGVLEKLPHCKVHRLLMRRKKNVSVPDLVYCHQVTDLYPNETMVCCSSCGTWRHAACGGHHERFSTRKNTKTPFLPICDFCHEEEKILCDYPDAQNRLDRQRMEQIRRGLATTSVMRFASFAKHGGAYKWPLGRVSATHMSGHSRSVHTRHDKAEKQWADMARKLGSEYGSKPRERARVRTKELERLLVAVEDAEAYTDRHNILLFLMRDTMRVHPVGFENELRNVFDPAEDLSESTSEAGEMDDDEKKRAVEDHEEADAKSAISPDDETKQCEKIPPQCAREGCSHKPRFDSIFCSDSCGVSALELDLLRSYQESSDIHPSVLRN